MNAKKTKIRAYKSLKKTSQKISNWKIKKKFDKMKFKKLCEYAQN